MACTGNHSGESSQDLLLWMPYYVLFLNKVFFYVFTLAMDLFSDQRILQASPWNG